MSKKNGFVFQVATFTHTDGSETRYGVYARSELKPDSVVVPIFTGGYMGPHALDVPGAEGELIASIVPENAVLLLVNGSGYGNSRVRLRGDEAPMSPAAVLKDIFRITLGNANPRVAGVIGLSSGACRAAEVASAVHARRLVLCGPMPPVNADTLQVILDSLSKLERAMFQLARDHHQVFACAAELQGLFVRAFPLRALAATAARLHKTDRKLLLSDPVVTRLLAADMQSAAQGNGVAREMREWIHWDRFPRFEGPTYVLRGEHDPVCTARMAELWKNNAPIRCAVCDLPKRGHLLWREPHELRTIIDLAFGGAHLHDHNWPKSAPR